MRETLQGCAAPGDSWFTICSRIGEVLGWRPHFEEALEAMRDMQDEGAAYVLKQPQGHMVAHMPARTMNAPAVRRAS